MRDLKIWEKLLVIFTGAIILIDIIAGLCPSNSPLAPVAVWGTVGILGIWFAGVIWGIIRQFLNK